MGLDAFTEPNRSPTSRPKTALNKKRKINTAAKKAEMIRIAKTSIIFPRCYGFSALAFSQNQKHARLPANPPFFFVMRALWLGKVIADRNRLLCAVLK